MPGSDETFFLDSRTREKQNTHTFHEAESKNRTLDDGLKIIKTLINKKEQEEKENAASEGLRVARSSRVS